jgi:putative nucleotidyltransferase with HDIG domain
MFTGLSDLHNLLTKELIIKKRLVIFPESEDPRDNSNVIQLKDLRKTIDSVIFAVSEMMGSRDPYTARHQQRVASLAMSIAGELGLSEWRISGIYIGGLLHDIGKVAAPSEILMKPGPLTGIEYEIIKGHCKLGSEILAKVDFPWPITTMILQHHERLNGSGYPNGARGNSLIIEARILGVADVVEAMSSHRPYRASLGLEKALEEIERGRGILYDPRVVTACVKLLGKNQNEFNRIMSLAETNQKPAVQPAN